MIYSILAIPLRCNVLQYFEKWFSTSRWPLMKQTLGANSCWLLLILNHKRNGDLAVGLQSIAVNICSNPCNQTMMNTKVTSQIMATNRKRLSTRNQSSSQRQFQNFALLHGTVGRVGKEPFLIELLYPCVPAISTSRQNHPLVHVRKSTKNDFTKKGKLVS